MLKEGRMGKEETDLRFGILAVQKGFVTKDDIFNALDIQLNEDFSIGKHRLIGRILLDEGLMTDVQVSEVVKGLPKRPNKG